MPRIGAMDRKIVVEVRVKPDATDGFGARTEVWAEAFERWAQTVYGGGSESERPETTASRENRSFKVRFDKTLMRALTPGNARVRYKDRSFDDRVWNLTGVTLYGRNETIELATFTER